MSYFIHDTLNIPMYSKLFSSENIPILLHHALAIGAIWMAHHMRGFIGSLIQICLITEASNPFVNARELMVKLGLKECKMYVPNGVMMFLTFAVCRVCFYTYVIHLVKSVNVWSLYDEEEHVWVYATFAMLFVMYALNLYWFYLISKGMLKALGLIKKEKKVENVGTLEPESPKLIPVE